MNCEQRQEIKEYIKERLDILDNVSDTPAERAYLQGLLRMLQLQGYEVEFLENNEVKIYG